MLKKIISTKNAPVANGCYSQAVLVNGFLFISGQLPIKPKTNQKLIDASVEEQTTQVLENIKGIVESAGGNLDSIVKVTLFISDISLWDRVNNIYQKYFLTNYPARCVVEISHLHYGFKIEAEATAYIPK